MRGDFRPVLSRNITKTHCPKGHPYNEANTVRMRGKRYCRECRRQYSLRYYYSHKQQKSA